MAYALRIDDAFSVRDEVPQHLDQEKAPTLK